MVRPTELQARCLNGPTGEAGQPGGNWIGQCRNGGQAGEAGWQAGHAEREWLAGGTGMLPPGCCGVWPIGLSGQGHTATQRVLMAGAQGHSSRAGHYRVGRTGGFVEGLFTAKAGAYMAYTNSTACFKEKTWP